MRVNPKVWAAIAAAALAVIGVLYPEFEGVAGTLAGLLLGKELLPQTAKKPEAP